VTIGDRLSSAERLSPPAGKVAASLTHKNSDTAAVCVEIHKPVQFLHRLRTALGLRSRLCANALIHGEVRYYELHEPPIVDWALPERIAMRKPSHFLWQREYRFAVPRGDAFAVENVSVKLVPIGAERPPRASAHPSISLKLGDLSRLCRVHHL
jgi:hypothetical protein